MNPGGGEGGGRAGAPGAAGRCRRSRRRWPSAAGWSPAGPRPPPASPRRSARRPRRQPPPRPKGSGPAGEHGAAPPRARGGGAHPLDDGGELLVDAVALGVALLQEGHDPVHVRVRHRRHRGPRPLGAEREREVAPLSRRSEVCPKELGGDRPGFGPHCTAAVWRRAWRHLRTPSSRPLRRRQDPFPFPLSPPRALLVPHPPCFLSPHKGTREACGPPLGRSPPACRTSGPPRCTATPRRTSPGSAPRPRPSRCPRPPSPAASRSSPTPSVSVRHAAGGAPTPPPSPRAPAPGG